MGSVDSQKGAAVKQRHAIQLAVRDREYPRNRRLRNELRDAGWSVSVVDVAPTGSYILRCLRLFRTGWSMGAADLIICSELGVQYAWVAWCLARVRRAVLCVDMFVGMHETNVLDAGEVSLWSLRARVYLFFDWLAVRLSDIALADTELRACRIRHHQWNREPVVLSLPVGAPAWARPVQRQDHEQDDALNILFYGGYLPLHGVPFILRNVAMARRSIVLRLTLIGNGSSRGDMEKLSRDLGIDDVCDFRDSVPEWELADRIADSDVVLGVFGTSAKAESVIANKVWQGLACERPVVTRSSVALAELDGRVGSLLHPVDLTDPGALASELVAFSKVPASRTILPSIADMLEQYVGERYRVLIEMLDRHPTDVADR